MATTHDTVIAAIHAELDSRLVGAGGTAISYGIGHDQRGQNARRPRVTWDDSQSGGTIQQLVAAGGNAHHLARDARTFEVTIWHSTRENCLLTLHNLIASTYYAGYQRNVAAWDGDYQISADGASRSGVTLTIKCTVTIIATLDIFATIEDPEIGGLGVMLPSGEVFSQTRDCGFDAGFDMGFC